jgi:hypothetical protein
MKIPPPTDHDRAVFEAEARADRASDRVAAEVRRHLDDMERSELRASCSAALEDDND